MRGPVILSFALLLAGCTVPLGPDAGPAGGARTARAADCRAQAEQAYQLQHPSDVMNADAYAGGLRDTPYSGMGVPTSVATSLSGRFLRERLYRDCLSGQGVFAPSR